MEAWKDVAIAAIRKEILALITEQKSALIKAGPGKDKDVHAIVDDLHTVSYTHLTLPTICSV